MLYGRGLAMGAADLVPGVSGATVALITGIYPRLIASLGSLDANLARHLLRGRVRQAWQHLDGGFLALVVAGIATSLALLASPILHALEHHRTPLLAAFAGVIAVSTICMLHEEHLFGRRWPLWRYALLGLGVLAMLALGSVPQAQLAVRPPLILAAAMLASMAMILPGISGGFVLLVLGLYEPSLRALQQLDLGYLGLLAAGVCAGLLCFGRVLHWLLRHYSDAVMALVLGLLGGSLALLWPPPAWQMPAAWLAAALGGALAFGLCRWRA